jgi:hypothetical protein
MSRNWILGALVAATTFGCATAPKPATADAHAAAGDKTVTAAALAKEHCVKDTGSYIKRPEGDCINQPGATYSNQELLNTGRLETAEALKQLDPRIQ